jgi:hypothetical protein
VARIGFGALLAVAMCGLPSACEGQAVPGFREAGRSARVRLFTRSESAAPRRARADLARIESYLGRVEALLDERPGRPIDYYRYERPEDIAAQTGVYATGLTSVGGTVVHSTLDYHPHELVHVVAGRLGDPGRFLHEGLAVALGDEGRWGGRDVDQLAAARGGALTWSALRDGFERLGADTAYPLAGSFVKHLIHTEGLPRLVAFFRACPAGGHRIEAAFHASYGFSLEDAVAAWRGRLTRGRKKFPIRRGGSRRDAQADNSHNSLEDGRLMRAGARGTTPAPHELPGGDDGQ